MNAEALKSILEHEHLLSKKLLSLTQSEQAALMDTDVASLEALCAEKAMIVGEIGRVVAQRQSLVTDSGYATDRAGTSSCLGSYKPLALEALWREIVCIMDEARELNRLNGILIARQLAKTQSGLQALSPTVNATELYGPNGQSSMHTSGSHRVTG